MTERRLIKEPTFKPITLTKERDRIILEIKKMKPKAEVSIEGVPDLGVGKIIEWDEARKLLTVKWTLVPEAFQEMTGSKTGLRNFFKVQLFTTQLVFKTEALRRLDPKTYQYRIPEALFQNQLRAALRVPLPKGYGQIKSNEGKFEILDLSVGGAKVAIPEAQSKRLHELHECTLILDGISYRTPEFECTVTSRGKDATGLRFSGLNEGIRIEIKQALVDALRVFYKEGI